MCENVLKEVRSVSLTWRCVTKTKRRGVAINMVGIYFKKCLPMKGEVFLGRLKKMSKSSK